MANERMRKPKNVRNCAYQLVVPIEMTNGLEMTTLFISHPCKHFLFVICYARSKLAIWHKTRSMHFDLFRLPRPSGKNTSPVGHKMILENQGTSIIFSVFSKQTLFQYILGIVYYLSQRVLSLFLPRKIKLSYMHACMQAYFLLLVPITKHSILLDTTPLHFSMHACMHACTSRTTAIFQTAVTMCRRRILKLQEDILPHPRWRKRALA